MYAIAQETPADVWEVEALYDLCFAPGREALSSYRLRDDVARIPELSLLARDKLGILAGAIRYWPVLVGNDPALLLGPVAVHPTRQGEGLGGLLMQQSLGMTHELGWPRVMLVGDYPYYSRFGFEKLENVEMPPPTNPDRVLGIGDWTGVEGPVRKWGSDPI